MAKSLEELKELIKEKYNPLQIERLESVSAAQESGEFDGAASWFGHADDALDAGFEMGYADAIQDIAIALGMTELWENK